MLTPLQQRVIEAVRALPESQAFALAGGAGLVIQGTSTRPTNDLDFFAEHAIDVDRFRPALEQALRQRGLTVKTVNSEPGFARLVVTDGDEETLIDLAYDARLFAPVETDLGSVLALDELAADKTLAVFGRAEARDFVDLHALSGRYSLNELIKLASAKDTGFDLSMFAQALKTFRRHPRAMFQVTDSEYEAIQRLVTEWRDILERTQERLAPDFEL